MSEDFGKVEAGLEKELRRLKALMGMGGDLRLDYRPGLQVKDPELGLLLHGEVKGHTIYVYDDREKVALATLRHEFIETLIKDNFSSLYNMLLNSILNTVFEKEYLNQERVVEALVKLIERTAGEK